MPIFYNGRELIEGVPRPATSVPPEAGTVGGIGESDLYARGDHTHEVRARRRRVTLTLAVAPSPYAGQDVARWVFGKPFLTKPIIVCSPEDDGGQPVFAGAIKSSFEQDANGLWTAVTVRGQRSRPLPSLGILAIPALNNALALFNVFGASAAGVVVGLTAAEETPTT